MLRREIEDIAAEDGRFTPEIIKFVYEGLGFTVKNYLDEPSHVTGQMLCQGLRDYAIETWGNLAKMVLNSGGVRSTRDFGEIVYLMIENNWMSAQPTDNIEDFDNVYDFESAFTQDVAF